MKLHPLHLALASLALFAGAAQAQSQAKHHHAIDAATAQQLERDPFAPVYIVTSRDTYQASLQGFATNASGRRDSVGSELVLAQVLAHQLTDISHRVHEDRKQCGGYFAFASRAQADAFIRSERAAQAVASTTTLAYTIDNQATVSPWLPQVSASNIFTTIDHLQGYQNRYYASTTGQQAAEWIRSTWQNLGAGRSDVSSELFTACSNCSTQPSVILTIQGAELPNEIVVLGGHLDSINSSGGGSSTQRAPGADDDASGIATLTEVLRVALASGWQPKRTVKFMAYAAEEVGLRGSNAIAQSFKNSGKNVVGVLQLDMTNYRTGSSVDMRITTDYTNTGLNAFMGNVFDTYLAPLGLVRGTTSCGYACSDHASWTSAGYPAGFMFEATTFNQIHSTGDTLANMGNNTNPSANIGKFALAFLGELAKTAGTTGNTPPVANFSSSVNGLTVAFTDTSSDADGSIASRSWTFGDGTQSTAATPSKTYAAAGTYSVALTVTDNGGASNTRTSSVTVGSGGGSVLSNGVAKTGQSGAAGAELRYTLPVPTDTAISNLKFVTAGGSGDADLYVKYGSAPTTTLNDCKSEGSSNAETCTIGTVQAGTYHVLVKGYSAFSGLSITGSYSTGPGVITYSNPADVTISDNVTVDSPITVSGRSGNAPTNASITVAIVHTYKGDLKVDLVAPDGSLYNLHNRTGGSADNVTGTFTKNLSSEALNGTWKLRVNDNASGDVGRIDSWSITF
ncbi:M20/M25/M40 family metallo-hydrolase [Lysobacter koreensis]|uniref:M20/M25/M40 family metallo-hydrolase n=1 Tax=Lysobacter koreensis TaxID=266122 RepID=A0ABW2YNX5_9GAMM